MRIDAEHADRSKTTRRSATQVFDAAENLVVDSLHRLC